MVKSNALTVLNNSETKNTTNIEPQHTSSSTIYRYMMVPKPYLTHVQLEQSPDEVGASLQKILPAACFDLDAIHDFHIFFETEQLFSEDKLQEIARSISKIKENKRTHFYYFTLKDPTARICVNLKRFDNEFHDIINNSLPGICTYSVYVAAKYFRFQTIEPLTDRHLRCLEKQLMKKIPMFHSIFWQNFEDLFKRLSPRTVARMYEMKTTVYAEYDKEIESDFIIKPIF